jgi:hypothetical protein
MTMSRTNEESRVGEKEGSDRERRLTLMAVELLDNLPRLKIPDDDLVVFGSGDEEPTGRGQSGGDTVSVSEKGSSVVAISREETREERTHFRLT